MSQGATIFDLQGFKIDQNKFEMIRLWFKIGWDRSAVPFGLGSFSMN